MIVPNWLIAVVSWSIIALGALVIVAGLLYAFWLLAEWSYRHFRMFWEYDAFLLWRLKKRRQEPKLAELLDYAKIEAEQARKSEREARALIAAIDYSNRSAVGIGDVAKRVGSKLINSEWEAPPHDLVERAYYVGEDIAKWEAEHTSAKEGK